jgi:short-subunit dehydrogenase
MLGFSESLRSELAGTGIVVTSAIFGTIDSPYWLHNPGSEERLPRASRRMRRLTVDDVAQAMADAIERDAADIVRPPVGRLLFLFEACAPGITRRIMRRGWKPFSR